jgi:hypothetical protein
MEPPSIEWSSARVNGGKLTVRLQGDRPSGWKERFRRTAGLLGSQDWERFWLFAQQPGSR